MSVSPTPNNTPFPETDSQTQGSSAAGSGPRLTALQWLAEARRVVWEGREPGNLRILLMCPKWEDRLLRFLEFSGVGRVRGRGVFH
jgi:hypothetical protein